MGIFSGNFLIRLSFSYFFSLTNVCSLVLDRNIAFARSHYNIEKDAGALIAKGSDTESPQNGLSLRVRASFKFQEQHLENNLLIGLNLAIIN